MFETEQEHTQKKMQCNFDIPHFVLFCSKTFILNFLSVLNFAFPSKERPPNWHCVCGKYVFLLILKGGLKRGI